MVGVEIGKCDMCETESVPVNRKYYHYNIKCECCNGKDDPHFEIVRYCKTCRPKPPSKVVAVISPNVGEELDLTKLKQMRISKKMSIMELAGKVGVSRTTIYAIESGRKEAMYCTVVKIIKALGYEMSVFEKLV